MKKRWLIIPIALFLLESIYFVGTWIFLNRGPLFKLLNTDPHDIWLEYDSAYSPFPGLVYLRNARFRAEDDAMQLHFTLERARVVVDLFALTRKEFVTNALRGDGLDFRVRFKRTEDELKAPEVKALPEIPGLTELLKPPPKPPRVPGPWRIRLNNIYVTNLRSIWLDVIRFRGDSEVHGGFELRPARGAGVFPARFLVHHGEVTLRGTPAARIDKGDVTGRIESFMTDQAEGLKIFKYASGHVALDGEVEDVGFLNHYVQDVKWLTFEGGGGPLHADIGIEKGMLQRGSRLEVVSHDMRVNMWAQQASGNAKVQWNVDPHGQLDVKFEDYRLQHKLVKDARIEGRSLDIGLTTRDLDLAKPFEMRTIRLKIPEARITDCRYFNAYIPRGTGLKLSGGSGKIRGDFAASRDGKDEDRGEVRIELPKVGAEFGNYRMQGTVNAKVLFHRGNLNSGNFQIVGTNVDLANVQGAEAGKKPDPANIGWWGNVFVSRGTLRLREHLGVNAEITMRGRDARPVLAVLAAKGGLPGWVASILSFQNLKGIFGLEVRDDFFAVHGGEIKGDHMALSGWLRQEEESKEGRVLLEVGPLAAGIELDDEGTHVHINNAKRWFKSQPEK